VAIKELLREKKSAEAAMKTLHKDWSQNQGDENQRCLSWAYDYFGSLYEKRRQERFRQVRLTDVIAKLVIFCWSTAERPDAAESQLGFFKLTDKLKTHEALAAVGAASEGVVVSKQECNTFVKAFRLLVGQGGNLLLSVGRSPNEYECVKEVLPQGFAGVENPYGESSPGEVRDGLRNKEGSQFIKNVNAFSVKLQVSLLLLALFCGPQASAQDWSTTDALAYIMAAGWCTKEEGYMSSKDAAGLGGRMMKDFMEEHGISMERVERIIDSDSFTKRMSWMIDEHGGCRKMIGDILRKGRYK